MNEKIDLYLNKLLEEKDKLGLTSFTDKVALYKEGVQPVELLYERFRDKFVGKRIGDVGAGNGLIGITLKILDPALDITLVERNIRKAIFLRYISRILGLGVKVEARDVSELRGAFDLIVTRGFTGDMRSLLAGLNLPGEIFIVFKGHSKFKDFFENIEVIGQYSVGMFHVEQRIKKNNFTK